MEKRILKNRIISEERETHILYDPETDTWTMESNIPRHFNKAMRVGWEPICQYCYEDGSIAAMTLSSSERGLTIKTPKKRELTDEHKAKLFGSKTNNLE